jgi:peptidoglycan/LPS O-acetylase OafA/YrhL
MKYQAHIDGLRAIAVIAVVMFHAFPNITSGGYIGVDIFFVISGYLITSIILADLDSGRFTLSEFYFRRIRRIFPALITVLIACFAFGWFYLLADEFSLLGKHIAAGATFVSNLLLWQEVGYFDVQSESKPLLHLWSLAIEEQFYLIWPWLVIFGMRLRRLKTVVLIFTIASLILNLICVWYFPSATFYLPLTRFWELGIGGALALYATELQEVGFAKKRILATLGVILVIASVFIFKGNWTFPGFWALIPVLGSALVLLYAQSFKSLYFALSNRVLVAIGLISFPLYLWHWPLLTFYHLLDPDHNSLVISLLVLFSFGLAALTFQYIEKPLRIRSAKKSAGYLLLLMGLIFLLGMYI